MSNSSRPRRRRRKKRPSKSDPHCRISGTKFGAITAERLADRLVTVQLAKMAKAWAAEKSYDPVFGARPLKRFLQRQIETKLARALISGEVGEDAVATFQVKGDDFVLAGAPSAGVKRDVRRVGTLDCFIGIIGTLRKRLASCVLNACAYTAQVTGVGGVTGVVLVEIYEVP